MLILQFAVARPAAGADASAEDKRVAKTRFVSGQSHYNLNEFAEALTDFKEGYRLFPDPVFLYNLGQCERQLGHYDEAVRFYRNFLREQPKAPNRQDVLRKIDEMESFLKSKQGDAEKAATPAAVPELGKPELSADEAKPAETGSTKAAMEPATPATKSDKSAEASARDPAPAGVLASPATPAPAALATPATPIPDRIDLSASTTASPAAGSTQSASEPFYARWWFWTAATVVAAGAGFGIYAATTGSSSAVPTSALGAKKVF